MTSDIDSRVLAILTDVLFVEVSGPQMDLVDEGLIDSLGFTTLLAELEERFGLTIELTDLDVDRFRTPERIDAFVNQKLAGTNDEGFVR